MDFELYHLSPVILTDAIWASYTDEFWTSGTATQRQNAYTIAERRMMNHLMTPLTTTTVTGTFVWPAVPEPILLPHRYIRSIDRVNVLSLDTDCNCDVSDNTGCALIRNGVGYIDVRVTGWTATAQCGCGHYSKWLYQCEVTWTAGLPDSVRDGDPALHNALAVIASEALTQIVESGAGPGGQGAPGVQGFQSIGYSEQYNPASLKVTPLGTSAAANYAASLVKHLKKKVALRF